MAPERSATAVLLGTIIGAGFLGIPYVVQQAGFFIGLVHLLLIGTAVALTTLYLGTIACRTTTFHHLTGYASHYLGSRGKSLMLFATLIGIISALVAYLVGEGTSLSYLLTGNDSLILPAALLFWLFLALLTAHGKNTFVRAETFGVSAMLLLMLAIIIIKAPRIQLEHLTAFSSAYAMLPFGVILFSFLGFSAIPEMKLLLKNDARAMKRSIMRAYLIAFVLYVLFTLVVVGVYSPHVPHIATLALGTPFIVLSLITLFTAYLALSIALIDTLRFDLALPRWYAWLLTNALSLVLFLILTALHEADFTLIISIGGILSGGITALLILAMLPRAGIRIAPLLRILLSILFIGGALAELVAVVW